MGKSLISISFMTQLNLSFTLFWYGIKMSTYSKYAKKTKKTAFFWHENADQKKVLLKNGKLTIFTCKNRFVMVELWVLYLKIGSE